MQAKLIYIVLAALLLSACAQGFTLGAEVPPPYGCTQAREHGHDC